MRIKTEQRSHDWIAYVEGNSTQWESGITRDDAIAKLLVTVRGDVTYTNIRGSILPQQEAIIEILLSSGFSNTHDLIMCHWTPASMMNINDPAYRFLGSAVDLGTRTAYSAWDDDTTEFYVYRVVTMDRDTVANLSGRPMKAGVGKNEIDGWLKDKRKHTFKEILKRMWPGLLIFIAGCIGITAFVFNANKQIKDGKYHTYNTDETLLIINDVDDQGLYIATIYSKDSTYHIEDSTIQGMFEQIQQQYSK